VWATAGSSSRSPSTRPTSAPRAAPCPTAPRATRTASAPRALDASRHATLGARARAPSRAPWIRRATLRPAARARPARSTSAWAPSSVLRVPRPSVTRCDPADAASRASSPGAARGHSPRARAMGRVRLPRTAPPARTASFAGTTRSGVVCDAARPAGAPPAPVTSMGAATTAIDVRAASSRCVGRAELGPAVARAAGVVGASRPKKSAKVGPPGRPRRGSAARRGRSRGARPPRAESRSPCRT
jgi:hypothetical protein